jgi:hypothetical protein
VGSVVSLPVTEESRARLAVRGALKSYENFPTLEHARVLVRAVVANSAHLGTLGISDATREAFSEMNPDATMGSTVLLCANAILRCLRPREIGKKP